MVADPAGSALGLAGALLMSDRGMFSTNISIVETDPRNEEAWSSDAQRKKQATAVKRPPRSRTRHMPDPTIRMKMTISVRRLHELLGAADA